MTVAPLLAHQGGWDEMLLVAMPIVIFVALLKVANERARRLEREASPEAGSADAPSASPHDSHTDGGTP